MSNEKVMKFLLTKVQTMLCVTFCIHTYSAHAQKPRSMKKEQWKKDRSSLIY